ncbi:4-hydroxyphenylpyruvate dioxygenase [Streptacidiphilus sp. P02-A3a]|uniref:4-hydroxyphenylpyruvate dioxygenase n=1 Tax=Streptacidiphilus sp. P02-A3a TaxID=2704468 RepID=UPI0015F9926B|nr:4-hydroxyphenylpyruvate dioxygenase [Streptacidiphilus sp. P02-A3a]QMU69435.1 4-hydroxyphenylpyruvate dioxygenase [Streptacidiphilus sp. P02-A3a]
MTIQGIAHIEYHCADADQAAADLVAGFGFGRDPEQPAATGGVHTVHLSQGSIRLRLSSAEAADHPVARFVQRHGDGVAVLALGCADPQSAVDRAVRHGARETEPGLVAGFGDVALRFVADPGPARADAPTGLLQAVDHAAICVPAGELAPAVRFCEAALGFHRIFGEYIEVGAQGMDSSVVQSASGQVTFTLLEPDTARQPGQIDTFLDSHEGTGVQHLAFRTPDIATAVRTFRAQGVEFLSTPGAYYELLAQRLGRTAIPVDTLRELDVLVDQDHGGQLFQIFTRSVHARRTFFLELIERQGAGTFGTANIKALYEAVERQNAIAAR